ncbi:MAG: hypothetical protein GC185_11035 [Alphaproteobacteria bacterium]|nr:hypothetical protein [Alphaproteobacteria bacterium]
MSLQPDNNINAQFMVAQARAGKAYYSLFSLSPAEDPQDAKDGKWELRFFVSGKPDDVDAVSPLSNPALHRLLHRHFSTDGKDRPQFESSQGSNMHIARVDSKERAEELAHELMELFEASGISPMVEELQLYKPPGAQKPTPMAVQPIHRDTLAESALRPVIRHGWHFSP